MGNATVDEAGGGSRNLCWPGNVLQLFMQALCIVDGRPRSSVVRSPCSLLSTVPLLTIVIYVSSSHR